MIRSACFSLLGLLLAAACVDEELIAPVRGDGDEVCLYATKLYLITRSGDKIESFAPGSQYLLYALRNNSDGKTYDWPGATLYARRGEEATDGTIDYGEVASFQKGVALDFYGAVVDRAHTADTLPAAAYTTAVEKTDRVAPTLTWRDGYGTTSADRGLGDLMVTAVKGVTSDEGTVALPFTHALTRFTFTVLKEDESGKDADKRFLAGVRLHRLSLSGTYGEAQLSLHRGVWSQFEEPATRVIYDEDAHNKAGDGCALDTLTAKHQVVPDSLLLFPNWTCSEAGTDTVIDTLKLQVQLLFPQKPATAQEIDGLKYEQQTDGSWLVTVDFPLTVGNLTGDTIDSGGYNPAPMRFVANSSYNLAIFVTSGAVRILTIAPTVYDWVTEELSTDEAVVGQPVSLGGLMWMDRNLGASTYDAENDFYGSIGYYYQYGRNIPYMLDSAQFTFFTYDDDEGTFIVDTGNAYGPRIVRPTSASSVSNQQSPCYFWYLRGHSAELTKDVKAELALSQVRSMYTYDFKGDTVCGPFFSADDNAFRNPGEVVYKSDSVTIDTVLSRRNYRMAVIQASTAQGLTWANQARTDNYWNDVEVQPCPKGWRLPTHQDLYAFMPWGTDDSHGTRVQWGYRKLTVTNHLTNTTHSSGYLYWDYAQQVDHTEYGSYSYSTTNNEGSATWESTADNPRKGWYRKTKAGSKAGIYNGSVQEMRFGTVVNADGSTYNVIYMIKWQGTDKAYRIRIMSHFAKAYGQYGTKTRNDYSRNKRYISISRYTAERDKDIDYYVQNGHDTTMWNNPVETLIYPCAGFLVTDPTYWDLRSFGEGLLLRTSESSGSYLSWVQYLATSVFNVSVENSSRRSLGDQIRCCRDITATY